MCHVCVCLSRNTKSEAELIRNPKDYNTYDMLAWISKRKEIQDESQAQKRESRCFHIDAKKGARARVFFLFVLLLALLLMF